MINLLPPSDKRQLAAARTNTLLVRYCVILACIIAFLFIETVGMYFVVDTGTQQNQAVIDDNNKKTADYSSTKNAADEFTKNLAVAKYILSKEISYTSLIYTLAGSLPSGAVLENLSLDPATFGTATTLTVNTISDVKALEVKTALQNATFGEKTPLFSEVSFQSVTANENSTTAYKYTAVYNVTYSKAVLTQ